MGDRFENTAIIETPDLDDYIRLVTKEGGTRRALASELAKKIVEEYEGSTLGGEERTIQAAIADAKQVASEALEEEQEAREAADTAITADLAKKAYSDGEYADLHAGTANQILSDTYTSDDEPYHYRATPSNAGTREIDEIVGGSVVWNQLVNTSTSSVTVTSGHKYVAKISDVWSVGTSAGTALSVTGGTDMVFDITQMFPSTIADHIYSLEQATAGAGVEFFKKYFGNDYHPFDAGTMRSIEGLVSHVTVGKNLLDKAMLNDVNNKLLYKHIKLLPNTTYTASANLPKNKNNSANFFVYKSSDSAVTSKTGLWNGQTRTFTTNDDGLAVIAYRTADFDNTNASYFLQFDFQIEFGSIATDYEPYEKHSYPLDNTVTLRGIPRLVDGKLKWDGDIYPPSGLIVRRYGIVDLGTLNWYISSTGTYSRFYTNGLANIIKPPATVNVIPSVLIKGEYTPMAYMSIYQGQNNKAIGVANVGNQSQGLINITDSDYTNATAFKQAMSGVYLVYELATPTTEQAEPYQELQTCSPYGTEEYVSTGIVPVGHYTKYPTDLKGIVEQIADAPSADGTYTLKATVSGGKVTYSWESA